MNDWKNPQFSNQADRGWKTPQVNESTEKIETAVMGIAFILRGVFGFFVVISINALVIMAVTTLLNADVSYRNSIFLSFIYVAWRAYDSVIFRRLRSGD